MAKRQRRKRLRRRQDHVRRRSWRIRDSVVTGAGISAGATLVLASSAAAVPGQTFTVGSTDDAVGTATDCVTNTSNVDCTLRRAIGLANSNANPTAQDYITFNSNVTGTIAVGSEMLISEPVYVEGPGANVLTLSGGDSTRIFNIDMAGTNVVPVGIYRLTLTHGSVTGNGGAIYDGDGVLKVNESVLSGNQATMYGGAIFEQGADSQQGGANVFYADTISGNTAGAEGGGIYGAESIGTLAASTVTGNQVLSPSTVSHVGAGVYSFQYGYVVDSTIAGNGPAYRGAGLDAPNGMEIYSSILANNTASTFPDLFGGGGIDAGFSLIEDGSPIATASGPNILGVDPQLGPLQNNGGLTPTMKAAATSPGVGQGNNDQGEHPRAGGRGGGKPNSAKT